MDRFSVIKGAKYVPTDQEVTAIRLAAGGEFRLYLELLIQTGARPSEGLGLPWADVGPDWVILRTRKTGTGDLLPRKIGIDALTWLPGFAPGGAHRPRPRAGSSTSLSRPRRPLHTITSGLACSTGPLASAPGPSISRWGATAIFTP